MKTFPYTALALIAFLALGCNQAELARLKTIAKQQEVEVAKARAAEVQAKQRAAEAMANSARELAAATDLRDSAAELKLEAVASQKSAMETAQQTKKDLATAETLHQESLQVRIAADEKESEARQTLEDAQAMTLAANSVGTAITDQHEQAARDKWHSLHEPSIKAE